MHRIKIKPTISLKTVVIFLYRFYCTSYCNFVLKLTIIWVLVLVQKFSNVICMRAIVKYGAISINSENAGIYMTTKTNFQNIHDVYTSLPVGNLYGTK